MRMANGVPQFGVIPSEAKEPCPMACPLRFAQGDSRLTQYAEADHHPLVPRRHP